MHGREQGVGAAPERGDRVGEVSPPTAQGRVVEAELVTHKHRGYHERHEAGKSATGPRRTAAARGLATGSRASFVLNRDRVIHGVAERCIVGGCPQDGEVWGGI
ncbi:hypothetical protein GCM10022224_042380 [Nonomuraea antimicrobica]|uniref:Uncharacterized protein n=1 Tax=Nonomuraea antimicrobica TaxID=561173 RepID=A0ABP7BYG6_9ACTN